MQKVQALYSRVSTDIQRDKGFSIPRQKEFMAEEAIRHSFKNIQHYVDDGFSATDANRPAYNRLMADIQDDRISALIVYRYDRVARSPKDLILLVDMLHSKGIDFLSVAEKFDTTTPSGKVMMIMVAALAQFERDMTIERVTEAMWHKARKGDFCGGQPPYGYDVKDKGLIVNEDEAGIVKEIYRKFYEVRSFRAVVHWLNNKQYKTKRGQEWPSSTVKRILQNPVYKGYFTYGKRKQGSTVYLPQDQWLVVKGDYPALISEQEYDRIQAIIKQRAFKHPKRHGKVYIISGLFRCECGGSMNGYTYPKKTGSQQVYTYYRCHNHISKGTAVCKGNSIRKSVVEELVLKKIADVARLKFDEDETAKVLGMNTDAPDEVILKSLRKNVESLKNKKKKLLTLYLNDELDKQLLLEQEASLEKEIEKTQERIQGINFKNSPEERGKRVDMLKKVRNLNGKLSEMPDEIKKDILHQVIKEVRITYDRKISIQVYDV